MRQNVDNIIPTKASATTTTAAIDARNLLYISAQIVTVGGTPGGTLKLQASNDIVTEGDVGPTNWNDISGASVLVTATPGPFLIPKTDLCYEWVRFIYTSTGSGTISATYKSIGA